MSAAGHTDMGNVTQDEDTQADNDYNNGLDNFHHTHMDSKVRAKLIIALRRVDQILTASGHGSRAERQAAREQREEGEECLQVPQEDLEVSQPPDPCSYDPAINQFLAAAPSKPEVLGKDACPGAVQIPKRMTTKEIECS
jgi:hypothetical protein